MIHNQALKESHRSFKWRPWVFNFNSHQLCSSTWTLTLFLGTVIPPTRRSRKCEVSPIRQESEDKWDTRYFWMWQYLLISTRISFWLHQLICTQVGIFACYQFCEPWGERWLASHGWRNVLAGSCTQLFQNFYPQQHRTSIQGKKIRTRSKSYELELSSRP